MTADNNDRLLPLSAGDSSPPVSPPLPPLKHLYVGIDTVRPEQHLSLLQRVVQGELVVAPLVSDWRMHAPVDTWHAGGLLLSRHSMSATRFERLRAPSSVPPAPLLVVRIVLAGRQHMVFADTEHIELGPGTVLFSDWSQPFICTASEYQVFTVGIPRHRLPSAGFIGGRLPAVYWECDSAEARQLVVLIETFWQQLPLLDAAAALMYADAFCGFLDGLLRTHPGFLRSRYTSTSRLLAMKAWLNERLHDPGLDLDALCAAFEVSRATVYRLFNGSGGVASYLQKQRLQRCLRELCCAQWPFDVPLDGLASHWGFDNAGRLSSLLESAYGVSAEQVVAARRLQVSSTARLNRIPWRTATQINEVISARFDLSTTPR